MKLWGKRPQVNLRNGRTGNDGGFTLIETALATTVLMIALMSASIATLRMHSLRRQNREKVVAQNAMRSIAEQVHAVSGSAKEAENALDWSSALLDAFGPGGTIGNTFNLPELTQVDDDTPIGTITIYTDETQTDDDLGFQMGLPRDLNGDTLIADTNVVDAVGGAARILPVRITLQWRGIGGANRMDHAFYVLGF